MRTKLLLLAVCAALVALATTSCTNDELSDAKDKDNRTAKAVISQSPDTRLIHTDGVTELVINWAASDAFTAFSGTNKATYTLTGGAGSKEGVFSADAWTPSNPAQGDAYVAIYPKADDAVTNATTVPLDLTGQTGTLAGLSSKNYMYGTSTDGATYTFNHKVAVVKLELTYPADVAGDATSVGLSATGLYNNATINLNTGVITNGTAGTITTGANAITPTNNKITAYLCILPGTLTDTKVVASIGGVNYKAVMGGTKEIVAGKMYVITQTLVPSVETYTVGHFYNTDGTVTANFSGTSVGIVVDASGLIMAFDESKLTWGPKGILIGTNDSENGQNNMTTIISTGKIVDYPAFNYCYTYKPAGDDETKWYLPARHEMWNAMKIKNTIDPILTAAGKTGLMRSDYWTSSENDVDYASEIWNSNPSAGSKISSYYVRPFRKP